MCVIVYSAQVEHLVWNNCKVLKVSCPNDRYQVLKITVPGSGVVHHV